MSCSSFIDDHSDYSAIINGARSKDGPVVGHDNGERFLLNRQLDRRTGRSKCSAPKRGPEIAKRDSLASFHNYTVYRRMILPTPQNIDDYIVKETGKAQPVVWPQTDRNEEKTEYDINTSVFDEFKFYQNDELSEMAVELKGCTMLVIVSRRGAWLGHFWENISFATDHDHQFWEKYNEDQDKIFEESVIKSMRNGKGSGKNKEQDSLRLAAPKFDDDHIKAYLVHPISNHEENGDYREYWDRMKAEAVTHLPKLNRPGRWVEHSYEPTDNMELLEDTARGRLLFKYDAKHSPQTPRNLAMLWSETTELHNDAW
ncbi:unnamed protein product [Alternaria alternata]